jgi:hypothetical protein
VLCDLTGREFPTAHPQWLRDPKSGKALELDGYNEELGIAIEFQGPLHTKPENEDSAKYEKRVARDAYKKEVCAQRGVHLIALDYRDKTGNLPLYLRSRIYDFGRIDARIARALPQLCNEKPAGYIAELPVRKPY